MLGNTHIFSGLVKTVTTLPICSATELKNIALFSIISMIETKPFKGASLCRAAGTKCLLIGKNEKKAILKLSSGWQVKTSLKSIAMLGQVSHASHKFDVLGKAGMRRAKGFRSIVRGVAKKILATIHMVEVMVKNRIHLFP